jgi:hypothetical protein
MPRRNRNAHTPRIDTDELAAQAAQLTTELTATTFLGMHPGWQLSLTGIEAVTSYGRF